MEKLTPTVLVWKLPDSLGLSGRTGESPEGEHGHKGVRRSSAAQRIGPPSTNVRTPFMGLMNPLRPVHRSGRKGTRLTGKESHGASRALTGESGTGSPSPPLTPHQESRHNLPPTRASWYVGFGVLRPVVPGTEPSHMAKSHICSRRGWLGMRRLLSLRGNTSVLGRHREPRSGEISLL